MKLFPLPFMRPHSKQRTEHPPPQMTKDQLHARLSQQLVVAQLAGKGLLGVGFITLVFGVTDHSSWALRTGLALLLTGMIASFTSLVYSFNRHRLGRQSPSHSTRPPTERRPGSP